MSSTIRVSDHLRPVCIRSFPIHEKEKRKSDKKERTGGFAPAKSRRRNERRDEGKETQEEKDEEGSSGLHRFLNLRDRMREGMARNRGWEGGREGV